MKRITLSLIYYTCLLWLVILATLPLLETFEDGSGIIQYGEYIRVEYCLPGALCDDE